MKSKVEVLDQDDANLAELVGLGESRESKPITIEKVDSEAAPANTTTPDNEESKDEEKIVKTSFISTYADKEDTESKNESDGIGDIAIVDVAAGEIKLPGARGATGEVKQEEHKLIDNWTFWYVYSMSHRDKKKIKQVRKNEYELREVYSFETVSRKYCA